MRSPRLTPLATAAILSVLTMTLASACSGSSTSAASSTSKLEKTNLVVGAVPTEAVTPLYIAEQRGIFAAHGLHVKLVSIQSSATIVPDLVHGTLDVSAGQLTTFIAAQAKGAGQFRVLASGLEIGPAVNELMALKGSDLTSPAALKGKTIAVNATSGDGVLLTDAALAAYGVKSTQVTLTPMGFPDMAAALQQHRVDAAYASQPYVTEMEQSFGATVVADLNQGSAQGMMLGGFTVTSAWASKYPHTAAAFTAAIDEASEIADTNLSADQKAFETYLKAPVKVADVMADGTYPTTVPLAKLTQLADLMLEFHELTSTFDASALLGKS